jgi:predicted transcriptional regulator
MSAQTKATVLKMLSRVDDDLYHQIEIINRKNTTGSILSKRAIDDLERLESEREEVKAAIADIEAGEEWEPVEDGEISSFAYVDNGGKLIGVYAGDDYTDWYATEDLPDNIRLCRRTTPQTEVTP